MGQEGNFLWERGEETYITLQNKAKVAFSSHFHHCMNSWELWGCCSLEQNWSCGEHWWVPELHYCTGSSSPWAMLILTWECASPDPDQCEQLPFLLQLLTISQTSTEQVLLEEVTGIGWIFPCYETARPQSSYRFRGKTVVQNLAGDKFSVSFSLQILVILPGECIH